MAKTKELFSAKNIAVLGVLTALVVVLQLFASAVPMFGITLNFSLVPIVLAGIFLGAFGGGFIGFVSGLVTFITCAVMAREPFTAALFQADPVMLTITCFGKTTIAGIVSGLAYKLIAKKNMAVGSIIASLLVPLFNTGLYVVGLLIMTQHVAPLLGVAVDASVVFVTAVTFIWLNFVLEITTTIVLSPVVHTIARVVEKQFKK